MNLSFSLLERARRNPAKFGRNLTPASGGYNSRNFRAYLVHAIREFHGGKSKAEAMASFEERCESRLCHQAHFRARLTHYQAVLASYCDGFASQNSPIIQMNKRARLDLGRHVLAGMIERFDMKIPTGFRATGFQLYDGPWEEELRWPLIQMGVAIELNCPQSEVEVGVFCFETGAYKYRTFTDPEIANAFDEATHVLTEVEANLPL
jgi:hypothetical protein